MLTDDAVCGRFSSRIRIAGYSYSYNYSSLGHMAYLSSQIGQQLK